ncbi:MAG TPA: hypothetical protein PKM73_18835 [Verrucomicrobiota bacterium]|nr:hypothetical protein [Verrucomicrobiota bacterium]
MRPACRAARRCGCGWLAMGIAGLALAAEPASNTLYRQWPRGPSADPAFIPIAVWLQPPRHAEAYRRAGINTYVGLWRGPTESQLGDLKRAGMRVICEFNETARRHLEDGTIIGWMHGDEPDNAQSLGEGKGYGPPIPPSAVVADYQRIRAADPTRPVLLNLGQGVAWDDWHGRGTRTRHPEDYPEYIQGADIVSFDIYPVVHDRPAVRGQLGFVARGVERLIGWTGGRKPVWNCIECTRISNPTAKPTPAQVRSEVWMSLIHGSRGLIYFVHEWQPRFDESALLHDPEMLAAVTAINRQVHELAPVLNAPPPRHTFQVVPDPADVPVAIMGRVHEGAAYVFAVAMRDRLVRARFSVGPVAEGVAEVLGESRTVPVSGGSFTDAFEPWAAHLYRVALSPTQPSPSSNPP